MVTLTALGNIGQFEIANLLLSAGVILIMYITLRRKIIAENKESLGKKLDSVIFSQYKKDHQKEHDKLEKLIKDQSSLISTLFNQRIKVLTDHFDTRIDDLKDFIKK